MRFRFFKPKGPDDRFAWLPKRMRNGTIVWLEPYHRTRQRRDPQGPVHG